MATFTSPGWAATPENNNTNMAIADKDYDIDADGKLTTDPTKAAFHLIRKGQEVPADIAAKYGIGKTGGEKAIKPTANKAITPESNKAAK